jgi:hypothetical protein
MVVVEHFSQRLALPRYSNVSSGAMLDSRSDSVLWDAVALSLVIEEATPSLLRNSSPDPRV